MPKPKIFIDGEAGTTGLRLRERLSGDDTIELLSIEESLRKDNNRRREIMNSSDIVFLCLPDDAAIEAVKLVENPAVKVIDTSTAHRCDENYAYGFPELSPEFRERIINAKRAVSPGCHATGFLALVYPLLAGGIIETDFPLVCYSLTGYSGGGKKMIAEYENEDRSPLLDSPRQYALGQSHKHLPEIMRVCKLSRMPVFSPIVSDFYSGLETTVPLISDYMRKKYSPDELFEYFSDYYKNAELITVKKADEFGGYIAAGALSGSDAMEIIIAGNSDRPLLVSLFDNLGKGASGAAIQAMRLMLR
jgi:N-acetyl-gamma-glutamyl-phosphate reductase